MRIIFIIIRIIFAFLRIRDVCLGVGEDAVGLADVLKGLLGRLLLLLLVNEPSLIWAITDLGHH